jgi:hypothetical protein
VNKCEQTLLKFLQCKKKKEKEKRKKKKENSGKKIKQRFW